MKKELQDLLSNSKLCHLLDDCKFYNQRYNSLLEYRYKNKIITCFCFSPSTFISDPHVYRTTWKENVSIDLDTEIKNIKEDYIDLLKESLFAPFIDKQFEEDIFTNSFHVPANKNTLWVLTVGTLIRYIWENPGRVNIMLQLHKLGFTPNVSLFLGHFINEEVPYILKLHLPKDLSHSLFPAFLNEDQDHNTLIDLYSYQIIPLYKKIVKDIESYLKEEKLDSVFINRYREIKEKNMCLKNITELTLENAKMFAINHFGDNE